MQKLIKKYWWLALLYFLLDSKKNDAAVKNKLTRTDQEALQHNALTSVVDENLDLPVNNIVESSTIKTPTIIPTPDPYPEPTGFNPTGAIKPEPVLQDDCVQCMDDYLTDYQPPHVDMPNNYIK